MPVCHQYTLVDAVAILVPLISKDIAASGPSCARIMTPAFYKKKIVFIPIETISTN